MNENPNETEELIQHLDIDFDNEPINKQSDLYDSKNSFKNLLSNKINETRYILAKFENNEPNNLLRS